MARHRIAAPWLRLVAAGAVIVVLLARVGTAPFVRAVDGVTVPATLTALAATLVTTTCCAWRWTWTARRLNLDLDVRAAIPAYYRSQFLNVSLPGGVLGDVHRALQHGVDTAAVPGAARAVVWDRALGQTALIATAGVAMVWLPSAGRATSLLTLGVLLAVVTVLLGWLVAAARRGKRAAATAVAELRRIASRDVWLPMSLSVVAVLGHLLVLVTAARAAGVAVPLLGSVPLLVTVLLGSSLPVSLAGWGPREGTAAWVFATAGLGAADGVTVAALYGVLTFIAVLPGAVLVLSDVLPQRLHWRQA